MSEGNRLSLSFGDALKALLRLPLVYPLFAFLLAKRVIIRGWSMYPTLAPGEYVLFDRLAYRLGPPARGDVVLASGPTLSQVPIVKRVVGVPGDRVVMAADRCWVNGTPIGQEALPQEPPAAAQATILQAQEYLLLGEVPEVSTDGRHFGPVRRKDIRARAWLVYWPPKRLRRIRDGSRMAGQA